MNPFPRGAARLPLQYAAVLAVVASTTVALAPGASASSPLEVTTLADTVGGPGTSLRDALDAANAAPDADVITFAPGLSGSVGLALGQLTITAPVTITGPRADLLTIDAGGRSRVADVQGAGQVTLASVTVSGGALGYSATGAGIRVAGTSLHLVDAVVSGNSGVDGYGGGVAVTDSSPLTITRTTIRDNSLGVAGSPAQSFGGGIYAVGDVDVVDSTLAGNSAYGDAGGYLAAIGGGADVSGTLTLTGSTVSGNSVRSPYDPVEGGGLVASSLVASNSTISGNHAVSGSGGSAAGAFVGYDITLDGVTVSDNEADGYIGGLASQGGTITVDNSIVAGNRAPLHPDLEAPRTDADHSLIGDASGGNVNDLGGSMVGSAGSPIDPLLSPLADNGGPTQTMLIDGASPAHDNGATQLSTDQRGLPRPDGSAPDMGAVELQPSPPALQTCRGLPVTIAGSGPGPVVGTSGDDVILGSPGDDLIRALGGDDVVCGRGGADVVRGGRGADRLYGGRGDDVIRGGRGADRLFGGRGDDTVNGGRGRDACSGPVKETHLSCGLSV